MFKAYSDERMQVRKWMPGLEVLRSRRRFFVLTPNVHALMPPGMEECEGMEARPTFEHIHFIA